MDHSGRDFLKDGVRKSVDFSQTPQSRGIKPPPAQKPCRPGEKKLALVPPGAWRTIPELSLVEAIARRSSRRTYSQRPLGMEELAFLLWAAQGLRTGGGPGGNFRTVPSAGCRHALETYVAALRVTGLPQGIYRYLPLDHALVEEARPTDLKEQLVQATLGQVFCGAAAATFIWTAVPDRMEWRYAEASYKVIALDAGHACQNLYLAGENLGAGVCAVAAYDQDLMDELLGIDGDDEFTVYLSAVGKR